VAEQPGRVVASFTSYRDAEAAVDFLSDERFPVQRIAIFGRDLQAVEQVTSRMGYGRAALKGAAQGALLGLLFGWLFGLCRAAAGTSPRSAGCGPDAQPAVNATQEPRRRTAWPATAGPSPITSGTPYSD
jgi:hypothetical protein